MKTKQIKQIPANNKKNPAQVMVFATDRKEEAMMVAVARLRKVATLIALARMVVEKTSDGINHAPGPIPREKKARYKASANTAKAALLLSE
mmetsp:Transcript_27185/g.32968  ORF Transcript_27185/g.32968 Transcript_27185/m.32968 type:complete len:91 (-) Transcript_27185:942-1214(-)